jgi:rhamnogalacturonan endolyase
MENLDRGVVAVRATSTRAFISWRLLGLDAAGVAFNVYRSANGAPPVKLNAAPLTGGTNFPDTTANFTVTNSYTVRAVVDNVEQPPSEPFTLAANAPIRQFLNVPLQIPAGGTTPDAVNYTYTANDASVADVDGDGEYEIILKWDPTNSKDNSQSGYTGNVYLDAYKLDGTRLWRIDLGINIRAGAHYTQFIAYDLDGDGKAEIAMKTAPGTRDGLGNNVILSGDDPNADYRDHDGSDGRIGYVLSGPEYLTIFNGQTGAAMATSNFLVARGSVSSWGDSYGNRVDRFLAGVAYLDGVRPSLIMGRGYYERTTVSAWNWRDGALTQAWATPFDSEDATPDPAYEEMGAHSLSIADVDGDGRDEIIYGDMTLDDDGTGLYSSGFGHGDALHVSDMIPSRPGLEVFQVHENSNLHQGNGGTLRDAATGALIFGVPGSGDVGRGNAFDIDPRYAGYEMWHTADTGIYNVDGTRIQSKPSNMFINFGVWWDADPLRELLDGTTISDWRIDATSGNGGRFNYVFAPAGLASNNGTKSTPALSGDILGDWREEVIWRTADNTALQIWTTTIETTQRIHTLMHDPVYRMSVAWQNTAYNQPPHTGFFLGDGMAAPPTPNIYYATAVTGSVAGKIFQDVDGDGVAAAGDPPLAGVTVYLDANANVALDAGEREATSAADGSYAFTGVTPGSYTVRTLAPSEFVSAGDPPVVVTGGAAATTDVPHARIVYAGTAGSDHYRVHKNAAGKYEIVIDNSLAYTVFAGAPSLTFNLLDGDDALTLDFANGAPVPAGRVNYDGGAGDDEFAVVTTAAAQTLVFNATDVTFLGVAGTVQHANMESARFDGNGGWDSVTVNAGPAVTFAGAQQLQSLSLTGSASARFAVGAAASVARNVAIFEDAQLDLADTTLIIDTTDPAAAGAWDGSAYSGYLGLVASGYNYSAWDGRGIVTTRPDALAALTTIAVATGEQALGIGASDTATFAGQTVTGRSVILKYTYSGDLNLDGAVDATDYGVIDNWVQFSGADGYANGDINFDGVIDAADYGIIDNSIQLQQSPF